MLTIASWQELRRVFASCFLLSTTALKKITFFSLKQPRPLLDFNSGDFWPFLASLGGKVSVNLKLIRFMPFHQIYGRPRAWETEIYYHRVTPVDGEWWIRLPLEEGEKIFSEGSTPRIVPVGKWDWEKKREEPKTVSRGRMILNCLKWCVAPKYRLPRPRPSNYCWLGRPSQQMTRAERNMWEAGPHSQTFGEPEIE